MFKRILTILGLVGLLVVGIVVARLLLKSNPDEGIAFDERIECNYSGALISIDETAETFIIKSKAGCNLCTCNEERVLTCQKVLCPAEQEEKLNEE